jgi:LysM repeat protein
MFDLTVEHAFASMEVYEHLFDEGKPFTGSRRTPTARRNLSPPGDTVIVGRAPARHIRQIRDTGSPTRLVGSRRRGQMERQTTAPKRVLVIIPTMVAALVLLLPSAVRAGDDGAATVPYEVEAGDTLWEIAAERTAPEEDVRETIFEIKRHSGLSSSLIVPGQVLQVPMSPEG